MTGLRHEGRFWGASLTYTHRVHTNVYVVMIHLATKHLYSVHFSVCLVKPRMIKRPNRKKKI